MDKQKCSSEKDIFLKSQKRFCWKSDKIEVEELLEKIGQQSPLDTFKIVLKT